MNSFLKKVTTVETSIKMLLAILVFTIPSNLFKTFFENTGYVHGLLIDYLIPKIHLSDFLIGFLLLYIFAFKKNRDTLFSAFKKVSYVPLVVLLLFILFINQLFLAHSLIAVLFFVRVLLLTCIGTVLIQQKNILQSKIMNIAITGTVLFQSLLAWYQFLNQKSFYGYYFLGETNLHSYAGIAQSTFLGSQKILPYGTTAHPNILAGSLVLFVFALFNSLPADGKIRKVRILTILFAISVILLTQSFSAIVGLALGFLMVLLLKRFKLTVTTQQFLLFFLAFNLIAICILAQFSTKQTQDLTSVTRRAYLNEAAITMILDNPIRGVGLHNFTAQVEKYSQTQEVVRFTQPAHNMLLLLTAETGIIGLSLIGIIILPLLRKKSKCEHPEYILALVPIALLDHYLITLQSGLLLLFLAILFACKK